MEIRKRKGPTGELNLPSEARGKKEGIIAHGEYTEIYLEPATNPKDFDTFDTIFTARTKPRPAADRTENALARLEQLAKKIIENEWLEASAHVPDKELQLIREALEWVANLSPDTEFTPAVTRQLKNMGHTIARYIENRPIRVRVSEGQRLSKTDLKNAVAQYREIYLQPWRHLAALPPDEPPAQDTFKTLIGAAGWLLEPNRTGSIALGQITAARKRIKECNAAADRIRIRKCNAAAIRKRIKECNANAVYRALEAARLVFEAYCRAYDIPAAKRFKEERNSVESARRKHEKEAPAVEAKNQQIYRRYLDLHERYPGKTTWAIARKIVGGKPKDQKRSQIQEIVNVIKKLKN